MVDRELPLKPTLIFLACLCLAIATYIYYVPLTQRPPISQLYTDANDDLWVLDKNRLVPLKDSWHTPLKPYSLASHGIKQHIGQLIPLRNGGYIINKGGQQYSVIHNMRRFFRLTEADNVGEGSLMKCDEQFRQCLPWGDKELAFKTAWSGLALSNGLIVINDTSRHRVLLVDADGRVISRLTGFKFPNHVVEDENKIWIVDTNHHQIVALAIENNQLVRTGEVIHLSDYSGIKSQHGWPSVAYLDEQKNWWVMVNDNGMSHPGIYRLNKDNTVTRYAEQLNDASFMFLQGENLYVSQYPENIVWSFNRSQAIGKPLDNAQLALLNQQIDQELVHYKKKMWLIIALMSVLGIGALIYAIKGAKPMNQNRFKGTKGAAWRIDVEAMKALPKTTQLIWIPRNESFLKKLRLGRVAVIGMGAVASIVFISLMWLGPRISLSLNNWLVISKLGVVIALVLFVYFMLNEILKYQLGVLNGCLLIRQGSENKATKVTGKNIFYTNNELYANGHYLFWQNHQETVYDKTLFEQHVVPILQQGQRISSWQLFTMRIRQGEYIAVSTVLLGFVVLVALFVFNE